MPYEIYTISHTRKEVIGHVDGTSRDEVSGFFKSLGHTPRFRDSEIISFEADPDGNDAVDLALSTQGGYSLETFHIEKPKPETRKETK